MHFIWLHRIACIFSICEHMSTGMSTCLLDKVEFREIMQIIQRRKIPIRRTAFYCLPRRRSRLANVSFVHTRPASTRCFCVNKAWPSACRLPPEAGRWGKGSEPGRPPQPGQRGREPATLSRRAGAALRGPQHEPSGETQHVKVPTHLHPLPWGTPRVAGP